jgi:hypothetical protein
MGRDLAWRDPRRARHACVDSPYGAILRSSSRLFRHRQGYGGEMEIDDDRAGLSRREMLTRMGVGAGVVWAMPMLTSVPAHAAGSPQGCVGETCDSGFPTPCSSNIDCVCASKAGGGGICLPGTVECSSLTTCGPNNTCPTDETCVVNSCCGDPVCVPKSLTAQCPPTASSARGAASARARRPGTLGG